MNKNTDPEYQPGNNPTVIITLVVGGAPIVCMILVAISFILKALGVL